MDSQFGAEYLKWKSLEGETRSGGRYLRKVSSRVRQPQHFGRLFLTVIANKRIGGHMRMHTEDGFRLTGRKKEMRAQCGKRVVRMLSIKDSRQANRLREAVRPILLRLVGREAERANVRSVVGYVV